VGQTGGSQAAAYIEEKFEAFGLQPGWIRVSYNRPLDTRLVRPLTQPYLAMLGTDGQPDKAFKHQLDFGFVTEGHGGSGDVEASLTFVGFQHEPGAYTWESFKGLDLRDHIVLLMQENAPPDFATEALIRGARGVLWITGEGRDDVRSQIQLADQLGTSGHETSRLRKPNIPIFRVRPAVAQTMLEPDGITLADLFKDTDLLASQSGSGWFRRDLSTGVHMSLALGEPQTVEIPNVLGFIPGSDFDLTDELVILFASYDGLGTDPDGTVYTGANHNASGIAVLLELARLWQEQDLDARRSVLFVAWGGGQLDDPGARDFLKTGVNFRHLPILSSEPLAPTAIFQLDYLGAGGDALFIHPGSNVRLSNLLQEAAAEVGLPVVSEEENEQLYDDTVTAPKTPWIYFRWTDSDLAPGADKIERIEATKLQKIGEALALALTRIVRESDF
jgi:hypothetical protein